MPTHNQYHSFFCDVLNFVLITGLYFDKQIAMLLNSTMNSQY